MNKITYNSTRGGESGVSASQAILKGLADDGGLFMPDRLPQMDFDIEDIKDKSYQEIAYEVMKLYLTDYTEEELKSCIKAAYDEKFDIEDIVSLAKADGAYYMELFHGSTIAFKDMALSILPHLMTTAAKKNGVKNKIIILTATSGDTGKAAMAGFADVAGTGIVVFYPKGGVSKVQELQMLTQKGDNTSVVSIHGNFDDAQNGVKKIFSDKEYAKVLNEHGLQLSSANSINIGRLVPQIVYYVYAYAKLRSTGEIARDSKINVCVPTGNFGNILAAYMAKQMGVPIDKLICASNDNKVLYDFFKSGTYDRNRDFILTSSPSMDILISSNLERLIYLSCGCDATKNAELMKELISTGSYTITKDMKNKMADFVGGYATEEENANQIKKLYEDTDYLIDTHTGVASCVYTKYVKETKDSTPTVIASTASPYKFSRAVMEALGKKLDGLDEWQIIDMLHEASGVDIPKAVEEIRNAQIRHNRECDVADMEKEVSDILGL